MEKKILWFFITFLFVMNVIFFVELRKYENYYIAAEELLDELDKHYDWVDAYDPYEYYDAVQEIRNK